MACRHISIPLADGTVARAIVCGPAPRRKRCVGCGGPAARECDWKLTGEKAGKTCDRAICARCATSPAPEKDLCPAHAALWAKHPKNPARAA